MKQLFNTKAVIFDRDGVLINTEGLVLDSIRYAFKELGYSLQSDDIPYITGKRFDAYKDYIQQKYNFDLVSYREIQNNYFYSHINEAQFFKDTIKLIKKLYSQKIPIALTTSAGREGTYLILNKAEITNLFSVIVTKEDCINLKPSPEPYMITARKLGIDPNYCVVLEDTTIGVESAKCAGMLCIAIPNEYTKDQDFSLADVVVKSAKEIYKLLKFE